MYNIVYLQSYIPTHKLNKGIGVKYTLPLILLIFIILTI